MNSALTAVDNKSQWHLASLTEITKKLNEKAMTTPDIRQESLRLYENLRTLSDTSFPKKCATCGLVFNSPDDFIANSEALGAGSGLKGSLDDDDKPIIELFRNCVCGSTLMDEFHDRRDSSPRGLKRRKAFANIIDALEKKGVPPSKIRKELLRIMSGERSDFLEKFGVKFNKS